MRTFRYECKYILYFQTMYVYCVYPVMLNSSKQLSTYVTRAETSIVPIVFDDVLYDVRAYIIIVSYMNQIPERGYRV
jgi:hypothetical protein